MATRILTRISATVLLVLIGACGSSEPNETESVTSPYAEEHPALNSDRDYETTPRAGERSIAIEVVETERGGIFNPLDGVGLEIRFSGYPGDVPFMGRIQNGTLVDLSSITAPFREKAPRVTTRTGANRPGALDSNVMIREGTVHHVEAGDLVVFAHFPQHGLTPSWTFFAGFVHERADVPDLQRFSDAGIEVRDDPHGLIDNFRDEFERVWAEE